MTHIIDEPSRTFSEYLLLPNETTSGCLPRNVTLRAPLVKHRLAERDRTLHLNIPFASAIMQAVSDHTMAIALARCGGLAFIFASQPIETQVEMIRKVKNFKAGFVISDSNITPESPLGDVLRLSGRTGHTTVAVTADGTATGRLLGLLTSRDYRPGRTPLDTPVGDLMTPFSTLIFARENVTLEQANDTIWERKLNCLPIVDDHDNLRYLVFRKDFHEHAMNPDELVDSEKRLLAGAGINTRDYRERVPALLEAGADILCLDSSDGFSQWQSNAVSWIKNTFGPQVKVGGGNIVDEAGFRYLVNAGVDFVKVGIGGGSICITREQKGIGRGQATAVIETAKARDHYFQETGIYIPLCSDGGIAHDYHLVLALAMGADFVMMGRYFARFDESPAPRIRIKGTYYKEYWGEGSNRARNWQRYDLGDADKLAFEEGVDGYVPYAGSLKSNLDNACYKIKSTMCNCGVTSIADLHARARLTLVSAIGIREGGAHDIILKEKDLSNDR
ncbi:IMP dehydrogenase [bacterium]|nr:IMP dehydrogenase [candidate division CSSED10-310 bacterium]